VRRKSRREGCRFSLKTIPIYVRLCARLCVYMYAPVYAQAPYVCSRFSRACLGASSNLRLLGAPELIRFTCNVYSFSLARSNPAKGRARPAKLQTSRCSVVRRGSREIHFSPVNTFIRMYAVLSPWARPRERKTERETERERASARHDSVRSGKSIFLSFRPRIKSGPAAGHAVCVVRILS
jgi:hypothetical protein